MRHIVETTGGQIADLAVSSETSSFALLNAIEQTVTTLSAVAQVYNAYARVLGEQLSSLADEPVVSGQYIDPEDVAISAIERVINTFNATRRTLQAQQASVFVDAELRPHHCESLSDAYAEALVALEFAERRQPGKGKRAGVRQFGGGIGLPVPKPRPPSTTASSMSRASA